MGVCASRKKYEQTDSPNLRDIQKLSIIIPNQEIQSVLIQEDYIQTIKQSFEHDFEIQHLNKFAKTQFTLAKYIKLDKVVGIRMLDSQWFQNNKNSFEKMTKIYHPNLIQIYDYYEYPKFPNKILQVEELPGYKNLLEIIHPKSGIKEHLLKSLFQQIVLLLKFMHTNDISHCGLTPRQIFVEILSPEKCFIKINGMKFNYQKQPPENLINLASFETSFLPPEAFKTSVLSQLDICKGDIWSCGIILYFMCCGRLPFNGATEQSLQKHIIRGVVKFDDLHWHHVHNSTKDLIKNMLKYDIKTRYSADDILKHDWFKVKEKKQKLLQNNSQVHNEILKRVQQFDIQNKLQQASLNFMLDILNLKSEKQKLTLLFEKLDKNQDGTISLEELKDSLGNDAMELKHIEKFYYRHDFESNKVLDFKEFMMVFIDKEKIMTRDNFIKVFQNFDEDGSGYLSYSEIRHILAQLDTSNEQIKEILQTADQDKDGQISQDEFIKMMEDCIKKSSS